MGDMTTIGLELAKNVFQVHGIDATGKVLVRRQLRQSEVLKFFQSLTTPCLVVWSHAGLLTIGHGRFLPLDTR